MQLRFKKGKASSGNIDIKVDGECLLIKVAEKFISFYTTVALKLVEKLPQSFKKFGKNLVESFYLNKGVFPNRYSFSIVSENTILKYLNSLGINKPTGLDGIPSHFVRVVASIIACALIHVINL